ncbi:choice-of-anchor L domain-containing protein [Ascidiimonas sp. W6]|uniref:choice-of-anchor L domain-containing protein n=1 Tax=Ascidiimonas meishanensis TaxID=3128903 RepID=UPI0030EE9751
MKKLCYILVFFTANLYCQITVDDSSFSTQQLVENVLVNSPCAITSNFSSKTGTAVGINGIGYFQNSGTSFPFANGIVLSTGKASAVPGPNVDSHTGDGIGAAWFGDSDLETITGTTNTQNASYIKFDFVPYANTISFDFLFASEEYLLDFPCRFSDVFAFILTDSNGVSTNLAVIPGTNIPVKVTEIHEAIAGTSGCPAKNEAYFDQYNNPINSAISLNGNTVAMTAFSEVTPGEQYSIKLVIADAEDGNYDSAVFINGGSFEVNADLGEDRTIANGNAVCPNTSVVLDANIFGTSTYAWYKDGNLLAGETAATLEVTDSGTYRLEFNANGGCIGSDEIRIEYANPTVFVAPSPIEVCSPEGNNSETVNLTLREAQIQNGDTSLSFAYFESQTDVTANNPILNPTSYKNITNPQTVIVEITSSLGCKTYTDLEVIINQFPAINLNPAVYEQCDDDNDGSALFDLDSRRGNILNGAVGVDLYFYRDRSAAADGLVSERINNTNAFRNERILEQEIYVRAEAFGNTCSVIFPLVLRVLQLPSLTLQENYILCLDTFGNPQLPLSKIDTGLSDVNFMFTWYRGAVEDVSQIITGETGGSYAYDAEGTYTVKIASVVSNCEITLTTQVIASRPPETLTVTLESSPFSGNNTITAITTGSGNYYYSLNNSEPQSSGIFTNVSPGNYTVAAFDEYGCGVLTEDIIVLGYMRFFTPNGDGVNDFWDTTSFSSLSRLEIHIFDRFGKLLKVLNQNNRSWDGTFNGSMVPSGDYWFQASFVENNVQQTVKGHFALKR